LTVRRWLSAWARWREQRTLAQRAIPDALWQLTLLRFPFLSRRSPADVQRLRELSTLFLADKEFAGAHGLHVDDEMAVAVAAQACLPVLRLGLHWYRDFKGIVVHADAVLAHREVIDADGVVHQFAEELSGEAMQGGPLMLSWRDVAEAGSSAEWGYNVVIHEFAHVLDVRDGTADSVPALVDRSERERWLQALGDEYKSFCADVDAGLHTLLDPYAAEAIDEFFAVTTEVFFVAPDDLAQVHPRVYELLVRFFQQDPARDAGAA
jgi:Mlc titration factor MtfA (ptsG expression regulator)